METEQSDIMEQIHSFRPNLKASTIKQYYHQLKKLQARLKYDNLEFLLNADDTIQKINKLTSDKNPTELLHFTSKRNIYNPVILYLLALDKDKNIIKKYEVERDKLNNQYQDEQLTGKISSKQGANFVHIDDIKKMIDTIKSELKPNLKTNSLTYSQMGLLKAYTLFEILIRFPTRNDLAGLLLITPSQFKKLTEEDKKNNNYIVRAKPSSYFVWNEFKTDKKYQSISENIPKDLEKIINTYIKQNNYKSGDIIFNFSRNGLSQILLNTSAKYLGGIKLSTTMIRKSYLSSKYSDIKKEQDKDATTMKHSVETANKIYIKDKDDFVKVNAQSQE